MFICRVERWAEKIVWCIHENELPVEKERRKDPRLKICISLSVTARVYIFCMLRLFL
jgi:hypothetical protein